MPTHTKKKKLSLRHQANKHNSDDHRLYRWGFRIRFSYLMMTNVRIVYIYIPRLLDMYSPLTVRQSIHPLVFCFFYSSVSHLTLSFFFFFFFFLAIAFYNPLVHTHSAQASARCRFTTAVYIRQTGCYTFI